MLESLASSPASLHSHTGPQTLLPSTAQIIDPRSTDRDYSRPTTASRSALCLLASASVIGFSNTRQPPPSILPLLPCLPTVSLKVQVGIRFYPLICANLREFLCHSR